jgi:hypothetical protein
VKRPNKLLQPFVLVIHDCWLRARSLCSVNPTVRRMRGFPEVVSDALTLARVFSLLVAVAAALSLFREPKSLFIRFLRM